MDNVSELTARAVAYLVVLQDAWVLPEVPASPAATELWAGSHLATLFDRLYANESLRTKALNLAASTICLNTKPVPADEDKQWTFFRECTWHLLDFVQQHASPENLSQLFHSTSTPQSQRADSQFLVLWPPVYQAVETLLTQADGASLTVPQRPFLLPELWRRTLRRLLYEYPERRVALAEALNYLPALVFNLLNLPNEDRSKAANIPKTWDFYLKLTDSELAEHLRQAACAVPFEIVLDQELTEINGRRTRARLGTSGRADPQLRTDELGVCALALSGGGIRSATFNLGLVQGLAQAGWLPRFDYLSTVSGGGYLGAWLTAWIKREGSLDKVAARLCPEKAPVPNAEEVRPIRWLRMYSNYLAPNSGIFSADFWTIGITWLRNTLLNQLIIVLALGSLLGFGRTLMHLWYLPDLCAWPWPVLGPKWVWVAGISVGLLLPGGWLAAAGMRMFRALPAGSSPQPRMSGLVWGFVGWAMLGAYITSWLLYHSPYNGFKTSFFALWPAWVMVVLTLLAVAVRGRYDYCFYGLREPAELSLGRQARAWAAIGLCSVLAAALGQCALVGVWSVLDTMQQHLHETPSTSRFALPFYYFGTFTVGVPLVIEAVALTVVARMALLGTNFPDERREWWGRLGAVLHLAVAAWLAVTAGTLLGQEILRFIAYKNLSIALTGGWLALVGKSVQLAFNARSAAKPGPAQPGQPAQRSWLDTALLLAPFLFGLGLLVLVLRGVNWLSYSWPHYVRSEYPATKQWMLLAITPVGMVWRALLLAVVLGSLAAALGARVGVNEFSLHHFYRNRLTRAYLGASRPRFEREQTANAFTGFDHRDDVKLCSLQYHDPLATDNASPYDGPFLIINTTLNATKFTDLAQQDRQAESFIFTPLYCGFDFARMRPVNPASPTFEFGYRPTAAYSYAKDNGPAVGTAMAISGAAANPNEGYHSSPATAFLLTLFNVRLGWWMGNPNHRTAWQKSDPRFGLFYLFKDLFGRSDTSDKFVSLSDGGHFDNMGLYELVRRRCRFIVLGDGEEDHLFNCDGLANAIRRCRIDFGAEIEIDVTPITNRQARYSRRHYAVGTIRYPEDLPEQPSGYLLYVKSSLTGDEPADVREYDQSNVSFPHQSTGDQFFDEAQFESYRRLGLHIIETLTSQCPAATLSSPTADLKPVFRQLLTHCAKPLPEEGARAAGRSQRLLLSLATRARQRG